MDNLTAELNYFFQPNSIAVIGASAIPGRVGFTIMANLINSNFRGRLYPVSRSAKEILGMETYSSIKDVPQGVDLVIVAIRPSSVPDVIEECGVKGVKAAIVSSAGFSEVGKEGKKLEQKVVEVARKHGIRTIGPNTQGLINVKGNLMALSLPFAKLEGARGISFICQTGYFYWDWIFRNNGVGLSKAVDLGNMCDLSHTEFLEYLGDDPETRVIVLQMEEVQDGSKFMEVARWVARKKPVIALKAGRTQAGVRAIASHTGCLAGNDAVYGATFKQVGIIRARDMDELIDLTKTFAYLSPMPTGNRVAVITFSGAAAALAADAGEDYGLSLAELSKTTIQQIRQILPPWASVGNPIDLFQSPEVDQKMAHSVTLEALFADPNVDAIMIIALMTAQHEQFSIYEVLREYARQGARKPIVISGVRDDEGLRQWSSLDPSGIITFSSIRRSMMALAAAYSRYHYLKIGSLAK